MLLLRYGILLTLTLVLFLTQENNAISYPSNAVYFDLSVGSRYVSYKEIVNYKTYVREYGRISTTSGHVFIPLNKRHTYYMDIFGSLGTGVITYDGGFIGNHSTSIIRKADEIFSNAEVNIRKLVGEKKSFTFYYSVGYAYRYWRDKVRGSGSYKRITSYHHIPVGFHAHRKSTSPWTYNVFFDYLILISGKNRSFLYETNPFQFPFNQYNHITFHQKHGYGYKMGINFYRNLPIGKLGLHFYYHFYSMEDSTIELNKYEPQNTSKEIGFRVSL